MVTQAGLVIDETYIWVSLPIELPYLNYGIFHLISLLLIRVQCLSSLWSLIYFLYVFTKSNPLVGASVGYWGGAPWFTARESWRQSLARDEAQEGGPHALQSGVHFLGEAGREQSLGGSRSSLEIEIGVTCRGHFQLRPEHVYFLVDYGIVEMVHRWGIRAPKQRAHCLSRGTGAKECTKGSRAHTSWQPQHKATITVRRAGGRTFDGGDGLLTGIHYISLHSK